MKPLNIADPAEAEYEEAVAWYRDRDARVAVRFASEVRHTLELIEMFPSIGSRVPGVEDEPDLRRMPVHSFPYSVVFLEHSDRVEVIAFAHYRRRPGYFLERLQRE